MPGSKYCNLFFYFSYFFYAYYVQVNFLSQIRLSHRGDGPKAAKRLIDIYFALFKVGSEEFICILPINPSLFWLSRFWVFFVDFRSGCPACITWPPSNIYFFRSWYLRMEQHNQGQSMREKFLVPQKRVKRTPHQDHMLKWIHGYYQLF